MVSDLSLPPTAMQGECSRSAEPLCAEHIEVELVSPQQGWDGQGIAPKTTIRSQVLDYRGICESIRRVLTGFSRFAGVIAPGY